MITRRAFLALPALGGWFTEDPLETRIDALENDVQATKDGLRLTIEALQEVAQIVDNNTAYFEYRLDELEARLTPPEKKVQV